MRLVSSLVRSGRQSSELLHTCHRQPDRLALVPSLSPAKGWVKDPGPENPFCALEKRPSEHMLWRTRLRSLNREQW